MRDRLLETLAPTRYRRFLVYVMGPYKAHDIEDEAAFAFLERVRDGLRNEGFNAFLATDAGIPLDEIDAGTQSLEFARASNAVVFVVRHDSKNLGVGIETGAVLEDMILTAESFSRSSTSIRYGCSRNRLYQRPPPGLGGGQGKEAHTAAHGGD